MRREPIKLLWDIRDCCAAISSFVQGRTFADYDGDRLLRSAVEREFITIGEAANVLRKTVEDVDQRIPEIRRIIEFRNRIVHGYFLLDSAMVWDVIENHLEDLLKKVSLWIAEHPDAMTDSEASEQKWDSP
jgi:uncharacterized protein with HEPN domain